MNKLCILTGASSGIGRSVAIQLSKNKLFKNVALIGRDVAALTELKNSIETKNVKFSVWEADLLFPEKLPEIIEQIYKKYGEINCLLNIAGYTDPQPLLSTSLENLTKTYTVNVFSPVVLMRETVKYMKNTGGKILNIASTAGMTPRPGWLSYSSSKASLISISQTLTDELSEYGINVYCVSPGRCATKLRAKLAPNEDPTTIMQPEEVASVVCHLINENENCLDGQNIVIRKKIAKT